MREDEGHVSEEGAMVGEPEKDNSREGKEKKKEIGLQPYTQGYTLYVGIRGVNFTCLTG